MLRRLEFRGVALWAEVKIMPRI